LRIALVAACALYAVGVLLVTVLSLTGAITLRGGDSLGLREMIWRSTLAMIRDHPAFGVGLDQFFYQYAPRYIDPAAWGERYTSHPHNLFLDFWTRLGIMGLAWIVWTLGSLGFAVVRGWQIATENARRLIVAATIASVAALVHGLVDNFYFLIDLAFVWWFLIALVAIASDDPAVTAVRSSAAAKAPNRRRRARGRAGRAFWARPYRKGEKGDDGYPWWRVGRVSSAHTSATRPSPPVIRSGRSIISPRGDARMSRTWPRTRIFTWSKPM
jgi:hypothetical protein